MITKGTLCVHFDDPYVGMFPGKKVRGKHEGWKNLWGKVYTNKKKRSQNAFAVFIENDGTKYTKLSYDEFLRCAERLNHIYPETGINKYLSDRVLGSNFSTQALLKERTHELFRTEDFSPTITNRSATNFKRATPTRITEFKNDIIGIINEYVSGEIIGKATLMKKLETVLDYYKNH